VAGTTTTPSGSKFAAKKTGTAWFDSAGATFQGLANQYQNFFEQNDGTVIATTNPDVKAAFTSVLNASSTNSCASPGMEQRLERRSCQRRMGNDALPVLDARRHLGQRPEGHRLEDRQRLSERWRQTGVAPS